VVLALVLVGVVSFAGLAVLSAYAPDLKADREGGANALSPSAVGFKGALVMLKALGTPVVVSRGRLSEAAAAESVLVLTPTPRADAKALRAFPKARATLIVLPKWATAPDPRRTGFVHKAGAFEPTHALVLKALQSWGADTQLAQRKDVGRPVLRGAGEVFATGTYLPLAEVDHLQTISGSGWTPLLVDEQGRAVLARSKTQPSVLVLADPDLLNTQGLAKLDNARAGMAVLEALRGEKGVIFDVTLNGYQRGRGLWKTMLEPPWLAATLCAVAAGILMGLHAIVRFGPAREAGRAFALGKRALVDNSAGLIRMARKEHELAPAYAALTKTLIGQAAGGERAHAGDHERWLAELARVRRAASPGDLMQEAEKARSREDALAVARKLYQWRLEMTRERR
jgi:hypothetical protein